MKLFIKDSKVTLVQQCVIRLKFFLNIPIGGLELNLEVL